MPHITTTDRTMAILLAAAERTDMPDITPAWSTVLALDALTRARSATLSGDHLTAQTELDTIDMTASELLSVAPDHPDGDLIESFIKQVEGLLDGGETLGDAEFALFVERGERLAAHLAKLELEAIGWMED